MLLLLIAAIDVVIVLVIQLLYDRIHGPDPGRFGLVKNLVIDAAFIVIHLKRVAYLGIDVPLSLGKP